MTAKPSQSEVEILQSLWDRKIATVREIHTDIQEHRSVGYTTTLKQVQRMLEKGLVEKVSTESKSHTYRARLRPKTTRRDLVNRLIETAFDGSPQALVLHALGGSKPTSAQIDEIRDMLDKLDKKNDPK